MGTPPQQTVFGLIPYFSIDAGLGFDIIETEEINTSSSYTQ
jgi:hypothetical protein